MLVGAGRAAADLFLEAFICGTMWRGLRKCGGKQAENSCPGIA